VKKTEKFRVLILDDDVGLTTVVVNALRAALPDAQVFTANRVAEAQQLIADHEIHFFILDVHLPDGNGIDFLCDLRMTCPEARVVVITAIPLPRYQEQANELGVLLFREKPFNLREVIELVKQHANILTEPAPASSDTKFHVSLSHLSALDIIQLKCLTGATQALEFSSARNGLGRIYFQKGQIVHAETATTTGEAAFEEILRWRGGRIVELPEVQPPDHTISGSWQALLLNIAQRIDENPIKH
jgi:DNA-binding response OmpR family regulator